MPGSRTEGEVNRDSFLTEELDGGEESAMANRVPHSKLNINMAGTQTALQNCLSARLVHGSRNSEHLFNVGFYNLVWFTFILIGETKSFHLERGRPVVSVN